MLLVVLIVHFHAMGQMQFRPMIKMAHVSPRSVKLPANNNFSDSHSRDVTCDTFFLNFPYYNSVYAQKNNLYFNGDTSLPSAELTSFVDAAHNGFYNIIQADFDTLAYIDGLGNYGYFPLADYSISLDSLAFYIGINGSQINMANDSLVINIFPMIDGVVNPVVKTLVYQGYTQLLPFIQNPGYVTLTTVGVGQQFAQGEGFAIDISYLNKDTATHCTFTYAYADSCGTIPYLGNTYSSPAYPAPLGIIAEALVVQDGIQNYENNLTYFTGLTGIPQSCLYVYEQNFDIFPFIHICPSSQITPPVVATTGASNITQNSATLNGIVNASNNITANSFMWGLTIAYGNTVAATPSSLSDSIATPISANLTGLLPYTTYHFVAQATYNGSTVYGDDTTFTTVGNLSVSINPTNVTCYNDSNGIAVAVATQGNGYTYLWNNGKTTDTISGLAPNTYSVTVSADGQTASASVNISQPLAPLGITPVITNVACYGDSTGSISVSGTGGTSPYFYYRWSNTSANVTSVNSLGVGNYSVTITDSKSCTVSGSYYISQPSSALGISVTATASGGADGTATASVTGGASPYSYSWNSAPVQTDSAATGLAPGGYSVTATDYNNCTVTASVTVPLATGIIETGGEIRGLTLFPNPANEAIQVIVELQGPFEVQLSIRDVTGKLLYTRNEDTYGKLQDEIGLSQFSSGVYILEAASGNQSVHQRFVIAR